MKPRPHSTCPVWRIASQTAYFDRRRKAARNDEEFDFWHHQMWVHRYRCQPYTQTEMVALAAKAETLR